MVNMEIDRQADVTPEVMASAASGAARNKEELPYPVISAWLPEGRAGYEFATAFLRNVGRCFFDRERCLHLTEDRKEELAIDTPERMDFFAQLEDKMGSMATSLRFHFPWEAETLGSFLRTLVRFWPDFGYQPETRFVTYYAEEKGGLVKESGRVTSDAELFAGQVPLLLKAGITAEAVCDWFAALGSLVFQDPVLCQRLFLPKSAGVSILPLEGISEEELAGVIPEEVKGRGKTLAVSKDSVVARMRHFAEKSREELFKLLDDDGYLRNTLGIGTERRDLTAKEGKALMLVRNQILEIARAAGRTGDVLNIMQSYAREATTLIRPTPFWHLIAPLAGALAEHVEKKCDFKATQEDRAYMGERMVRIIRRRRLALDRPAILGLVSAFRFKGQLDFRRVEGISGKARALIERRAGEGLELAKRFVSEPEDWKEEKAAEAISKTMGEFILQLRREELHTFEWRKRDYQALGMGDLWEKHEGELARFSRRVPGVEFVQSGDAVGEMTGQHEPSHIGHDESLREVPQIPFWMLAACMPGLGGFNGQRVVAGRVINRGNPAKAELEVTARMRRRMGRRGLVGAPGVFAYGGTQDMFAPTAARLVHHQKMFNEENLNVVVFRVTGTDAINQEELRYTENEEPRTVVVGEEERPSWQMLNELPHVFLLQAEDMANMLGIPERIKRILNSFDKGGAIICLPAGYPEVHSSFIRREIYKLNDQTLATLVHPSNIEETRELCRRRDKKRRKR